MKLATLLIDGAPRWGVVDADHFLDLGDHAPDLRTAIERGMLAELPGLADAAPPRPLAGATWLPPIPKPDKILCVGLNYETHRQETGRDVVAYPTLFTRFANTLVGHESPMVCPAASRKFDYEGELAIVIGRSAWHVEEDQAMDCIAGFTCFNDGSIRDWQQHTTQFTPGKNFLATAGCGPWMVTHQGFGAVGPQRLRTILNGQTLQDATLADMIFPIARIIAYCTRFTRLEPGDIIATGTPGGVGAKRSPPLWMKPGDIAEIAIDGVGTLRNPIIAER